MFPCPLKHLNGHIASNGFTNRLPATVGGKEENESLTALMHTGMSKYLRDKSSKKIPACLTAILLRANFGCN
jgi:hypothetical protein